MGIYFFIFLLPFVLSIFSHIVFPRNNKKYEDLFKILVFVFLFIISGLRSPDVGGDLGQYLPEFNRISSKSYSDIIIGFDSFEQRELGFELIEKTISLFSTSSFAYLFFTSLICVSIYLLAIYKNSCNIFVSVLIYVLYCYTNSFNIIRASIAVAICLYSYPIIVSRKLWKYLLLMLLACLIHKSSIFFIPAYFLYGFKVNAKTILLLLSLFLFISFSINGSYVAELIENYMSIFKYSEEYLSNKSKGLTNMSYFELFLTCYSVYLYKKNKLDSLEYSFFVHMLLVGTIFHFFSPILTILSRIAFFYFSYIIYFIPIMLKCHKSPSRQIFFMLIFILFGYLFFSDLYKNTHAIVPYSLNI